MPRTIQRSTVLEVLDLAIELERKTMELYAGFMRAFADDAEFSDFWFSMARHEASHCGALALVECILKEEAGDAARSQISFDSRIVVRLRGLLAGYRRELKRGIDAPRALAMAVDLEASELEDLVVELLDVVPDGGRRDQAASMLSHDLGALTCMIEKYCTDGALLARADELLDVRHAAESERH